MILADFFGTDKIRFQATSDGLPGVVRRYSSFSEAADEAGRSRIYGGIHWNCDNVEGLAMGRALARYVDRNFLVNAPYARAINGQPELTGNDRMPEVPVGPIQLERYPDEPSRGLGRLLRRRNDDSGLMGLRFGIRR
jgi:hypothetical protein